MIGRRVSEKDFLLLEVYRRRASECLVQKKIGEWTAGRGLRVATSGVAAARRMNLQKALIRAVMVVSAAVTASTARAYLLTCLPDCVTACPQVTDPDTLNHLEDDIDKHIDTYTKTTYAHFKYVAEILNAR
jgi:hypothetical protein